jgi:hypothetical protein
MIWKLNKGSIEVLRNECKGLCLLAQCNHCTIKKMKEINKSTAVVFSQQVACGCVSVMQNGNISTTCLPIP